MGFRLNCFTCITHLYLYYTLLVPHTYAFYIRHWCIFFHEEIQYNLLVFLTWYQSHRSDFFSAVLSPLVFLDSQLLPPLQLLLQPFAVKPLTCFSHHLWFRTCSRRHSESWDHCQTVATVILAPIVFLQVPLRSSSADLPSRGNLTIIGAATRPHMPPKDSAQKLTRFTRLQDPSRTSTCQVSPADVSLRWRHHFHVIC